MKRGLKIFGAVFFGLGTLGGVINILSPAPDASMATNVVLTAVLLLLTILLIHSAKHDGKRSSTTKTEKLSYLSNVPEDALRDMRKHYTPMQAQDDARIMADSFHIVQQTTNFETFFSRLELAQRCALTLLQAEEAGCKGIKKMKVTKPCTAVLSSTQNVKLVFLDNSYKKETESALQLKTAAGRSKRLNTYLGSLQEYEDQFSDVEDAYNSVVAKVQSLIAENQPVQKKEPKKNTSTADEIMKYKALLDAGAITEDEYTAKKKQLLSL